MMKLLYGVVAVAACFSVSAMDKTQQKFSGTQRIPLSALERINPLANEEEQENYHGTWNENLSLEGNLTQLCQRFLDACLDLCTIKNPIL